MGQKKIESKKNWVKKTLGQKKIDPHLGQKPKFFWPKKIWVEIFLAEFFFWICLQFWCNKGNVDRNPNFSLFSVQRLKIIDEPFLRHKKSYRSLM